MPGPDSLNSQIWRKIHEISPEILHSMINLSFKYGLVPNICKESNIKIIPKPDKNNYTNYKSYRPLWLM